MKKPYKYIDSVPSLPDEDMLRHKSFKEILDKRTAYVQQRLERRNRLRKVVGSFTILAAITLGFLYWQAHKVPENQIKAIEIQASKNIFSAREKEAREIPQVPNRFRTKADQSVISGELPRSETERVKNEDGRTEQQTKEVETPSFPVGYAKAFPVVGMDSLSSYFNENLQYPSEVDRSLEIEGTATLVFTITEEGNAGNIEIQNSLGEPFDKECIRLISNMPRWKPAVRNGKAVDSKVSLQLSFHIEK